MALQDTDLLLVQRPASKQHYKIKVSDLPSPPAIPDGNQVGDYLYWAGSNWAATDVIDGGTF
tara:strand:+ start:250 stop:435 length:186 start_codon:yes stop_codon:yes gene_type:complete